MAEHGRALPRSLPADGGEADARLAAACASGRHAEVLAALGRARVFAAMSAAATGQRTTEHGLRAESGAEMAVLLLQSPDGGRALPVFSSLAELGRWKPQARPVPLTGAQACQAALDEGAVALVLDASGACVVLSAQELTSLATGWVPVPGTRVATRVAQAALEVPSGAAAALVRPLAAALAPERLRAARLLSGPDGLVVGVCPRTPLDPAALAALAQRVLVRLGDALPPDGLDLAQVPLRGPGLPVGRRRRLLRPGR